MDYIFTNVKNDPFVIGGILHPDKNHGEYYRLDASKKEKHKRVNTVSDMSYSFALIK